MLFGRDKEIGEVTDLLDDWQLVTIVGPGGVGKTTLAKAVAGPLKNAGIVDFSSLYEEDIDDAVAGALGSPSFEAFLESPTRSNRLIIFDNCETHADAVAHLTARIVEAGASHILATSREPLDLGFERVFRLEPLATSGSPSEAGTFFTSLVEARGVDTPLEADDVEALVERLDGIPLALELAAARVPSLTPSEILVHLDARMDLVARARPRGPERHQSLKATVGWSHDLLDPANRDLLDLLSIFAGTFTAAMAAAAGNIEEVNAVDRLATLVDRSMITTQVIGDRTWYRIYDTVKAFSRERVDQEECDLASERAIEHVAKACDDLSFPDEQRMTLDIITAVQQAYPTIRESIEWSLEHDESPDRAFRLIAPLWWMEDGGFQAESSELIDRVLTKWPGGDPAQRARALSIRASNLRVASRVDDAHEAALAAIAVDGNGVGGIYARRITGHIKRATGDFAGALEEYERAIAICNEIGYAAFALELEMHVALAQARAGDVQAAIERLAEASTKTVPGSLNVLWLMTTLAYLKLGSEPEEAAAILQGVLDGEYGAGEDWSIGTTHEQLAFACALDGDSAAGAHHMAKAFEIFVGLGVQTGIWRVLWGSAAIFAQVGQHTWEIRTLANADEIFPDLNAASGPFEIELYSAIAGHPPTEPVGTTPASLSQVRMHLERLSNPPAEEPRPTIEARFVRSGTNWEVSFAGSKADVRHSKGMNDVAHLIANPRTEVAALDLIGASVVTGDAGETIDSTARKQYEDRIKSLQSEIDDAAAMNNEAAAEKARSEMDALVKELSSAYGLGGRARKKGEPAEKARSAVTWRIRSAIRRISETNQSAADHLNRYVGTGRFCIYDPPEPVNWEVSA